jgi:hypothetical protein
VRDPPICSGCGLVEGRPEDTPDGTFWLLLSSDSVGWHRLVMLAPANKVLVRLDDPGRTLDGTNVATFRVQSKELYRVLLIPIQAGKFLL